MTGETGASACCGNQAVAQGQDACDGPQNPHEYFSHMIRNCLQYAQAAKAAGRPVVGILCEFTPRELILAAGASSRMRGEGSASSAARQEPRSTGPWAANPEP